MILPVSTIIKRKIQDYFPSHAMIDKRVRVVADLQAFRWREDLSVWKQKKEKAPQYFSVYFDDAYVCGFDETIPPEAAVHMFLKGLLELVKDGSVTLSLEDLKEQRELNNELIKQQKRDKKALIKAIPESNKEEKLVKEAVKRLHEPAKKTTPPAAS